jgi:NAD(P)-dependent dehydrogenase (short-subunit alcohol dehydrogenase family)
MVKEMFDLAGRSAFVTGAASGLGFAMTEAMVESGAAVCLADVDANNLDKAVDHFRRQSNQVEGVELDVRDPAKIKQVVKAYADRQGRLDVMFANAGITGGAPITQPEGAIENIDLNVWRNVIDINLTGVFATLQAAAAVMKPQRSGRIIATASIAGMRTSNVSGYAYSSTKAAVIQIVKLAAAELAQYDIRVNGIAPGPFLTNIAGGKMFTDPARRDFMAQGTALKRVADPKELKGLVTLLASDAASYITGQVIAIDGGALVIT